MAAAAQRVPSMAVIRWPAGRLRQPTGAARLTARRRRCLRGFEHRKADHRVGSLNADFATPSEEASAENSLGEDASLSSLF